MGNNALFITLVASVFLNPLASVIADLYGRKNMFILLTFVNIIGGVISLMKLSYWYIVIGLAIQITSKSFYLSTNNNRLELVSVEYVYLRK